MRSYNMNITATYSTPDHTSIVAEIDGISFAVPADPANRHFRLIVDGDAATGTAPTVIAPYAPPPVTVDDVKEEAGRRILERYPDWYQRNMIADAVTLAEIGAANRTAEQNARVVELNSAWGWVTAVRVRSNELEANLSLVQGAVSDDLNWPG